MFKKFERNIKESEMLRSFFYKNIMVK